MFFNSFLHVYGLPYCPLSWARFPLELGPYLSKIIICARCCAIKKNPEGFSKSCDDFARAKLESARAILDV